MIIPRFQLPFYTLVLHSRCRYVRALNNSQRGKVQARLPFVEAAWPREGGQQVQVVEAVGDEAFACVKLQRTKSRCNVSLNGFANDFSCALQGRRERVLWEFRVCSINKNGTNKAARRGQRLSRLKTLSKLTCSTQHDES